MSPHGRPKGESRSAQHEGTPMNALLLHQSPQAQAFATKLAHTMSPPSIDLAPTD
jgi:hypothetical protein